MTIMSNLLCCTVDHSSDVDGRTGTFQFPTGLWKQHAGQPSGLPDASTPVGPECGGKVDLSAENLRPHN